MLILKKEVPCVTLRDNTERSETIEVGSNILAGTKAESILSKTKEMINRQTFKKSLTKNAAHASLSWKNPFGDGKAGKRIVEILEQAYEDSNIRGNDLR